MAKSRTVFACQNCGAQSAKWLGRCPDCGAWNTYVEETFENAPARMPELDAFSTAPQPLTEIQSEAGKHVAIGINELDRVLGSGYVPGSVSLIGGDPGIGKSTIILQVLSAVAKKGVPCLYVSGKESASQIKLRADRMGVKESNLLVVTENSVERILEHIKKTKPQVVVVDSIQTMYTSEIQSAPGTISQIRDSAGKLMYLSKASGIAMFLIGHVTKDGSIAGPKVLEHMVDTVLYFEGERGHPFRILRTVQLQPLAAR